MKLMKELNSTQAKVVAGGFWGYIAIIAIGFIADSVRHRHDKELARREGMEPNRRDSTGF